MTEIAAARRAPEEIERTLGGKLIHTLRKVPQYTRSSRHLGAVLRHSTPRKLANLLLVEAEYRLRRTRVRGRPYILIVDPTNICNLRCPLCPTGMEDIGRPLGMMPWETFTHTIDQLAPYAYELNLYNWGESILHPHIYEMIEYGRSRNLSVGMSANLNNIKDEDIDNLIRSGLEYLSLSIDGATQESYVKYRVRGKLDKVLANARKLVARREELGSRTPFIEWQFIVMKQNVHEIERARAMAEELGVDLFRCIPPGLAYDAPNPEELKAEFFVEHFSEDGRDAPYEEFRGENPSACFYMYRSFTVNPDGGTAPCCIVYGEDNDFGNLLKQDFREIWNNEKYVSARAQYRKGAEGDVTVPTVCDRCTFFAKHTRPYQPKFTMTD